MESYASSRLCQKSCASSQFLANTIFIIICSSILSAFSADPWKASLESGCAGAWSLHKTPLKPNNF